MVGSQGGVVPGVEVARRLRVEVAVEQERRPAAAAGDAGQHAEPDLVRPDDVHVVDAEAVEVLQHDLDGEPLVARRVRRGGGDQLRGEPDGSLLEAPGGERGNAATHGPVTSHPGGSLPARRGSALPGGDDAGASAIAAIPCRKTILASV